MWREGSSDATVATVADLSRNGAPVVLDLWTTKCARCPAALSKLNQLAAATRARGDMNTRFFAVNLDDAELARDMAEESGWDSLEIASMAREVARSDLGVMQVPYYFVLDGAGRVIANGNGVDVDSVLRAATHEATPATSDAVSDQTPPFLIEVDF